MKKLVGFVILYSLFLILCPSTKAQWYKPYCSYQWEDAQVQRLTYNELPNKGVGLYIDDNDKLYLFYLEGIRDTMTGFVYDYRILYITNEKGAEWSQPEVIETPVPIFGQNRRGGLWMDIKTKIIHILYSTYAGDLYDDTLYYTNSNILNWEFTKIDSLPGQQWHADYSSFDMEFDSMGNVHMIWHLNFDSIGQRWNKVMYANNSTGEWVKQQVSPPISVGGSGIHSSFAVQKNGTAHIVYGEPFYCDLECQAFYVRNDSLNNPNWITDTLPKPSRPLWYYACGGLMVDVDVNDRVHLITGGCIAEDCVWPGLTRTFYWYKQIEDSMWQGPEQIPDTAFGSLVGIEQLLIDEDGIPYASYFFSSNEVYFTDRKQGSWEVPYGLVGWHGQTPDSFMVDNFCFVLDSQAKGHGAFSAFNFAQGMLEDDSVEIYYLSSSSSDVDTEEDHKICHFNLFQNYPNPFNSSTIITYEIMKAENVTLKIYDILGREVRSLVNGLQRPGVYRLIWDGKNNQGKEVTSGIYFYQLKTGNFSETKKLVLIK
jgi:hypothetical protein